MNIGRFSAFWKTPPKKGCEPFSGFRFGFENFYFEGLPHWAGS
jgi:hypothetical protein